MSVHVRRMALLMIGVLIGAALGFAIGWGVWPMPNQVSPSALRWDYADEYVLMVASAYAIDGDVEQARQRLALLDAESPSAPVLELGERLVAAGGNRGDLVRLARLSRALGAVSPALSPYLEEQP